MKTLLLTGARAPVTLDFARGLKAQGFRVIAAESLEHALSKRSNAFDRFIKIRAPNTSLQGFCDDLIKIIQEEKVDLLIPTCEEAFHIARIKDQLPTQVLVDSFERLNQVHSKYQFNKLASSLGLGAPVSYLAKNLNEALIAIDQVPSKKVVLKPEFSRFASKTFVLEKLEAKNLLSSLSLSTGVSWVVQEALIGPEYCTYSLARDGKLIAHVTYDHEFTAGKGAGICFRSVKHPKILEWVSRFVAETKFTGQLAFDFIENETGVQALECNPRATSGLHLIAHDELFLRSFEQIEAHSLQTLLADAGTLGQIRLAMLVYGLPSIQSLRQLKAWLHTFFTGREVVFSLKDPLPFLDQFFSFYALLRASKQLNISPLEVSTRDIEWNGGPTP